MWKKAILLLIGAKLLEQLAKEFERLQAKQHPLYGGSKQMHNLSVVLCHLCNFKVVACRLLYDVMDEFVKSFQEIDVELLLTILRST